MTLKAKVAAIAGLLGGLAALTGAGATSSRWIVFSAAPNGTQPAQLYRVRTSGGGIEQITSGRRIADDPAFSPGGKRLVFARYDSGLFMIGADGSGLRRVTAGAGDRFPAWSPDGKSIAFLRAPHGSALYRVYVMRPDGRAQRLLRRGPAPAGRPSWTANGKSIVIPANGSFFQVSAKNGRPEKRLGPTYDVGNGDPTDPLATLSPNGRTIALIRARPSPEGCIHTACEVFALYLADTATGRTRRFMDDAGPAGWSPDGRTLAYFDRGGLELRPARGGTAKAIPLGTLGVSGSPPAWQPR